MIAPTAPSQSSATGLLPISDSASGDAGLFLLPAPGQSFGDLVDQQGGGSEKKEDSSEDVAEAPTPATPPAKDALPTLMPLPVLPVWTWPMIRVNLGQSAETPAPASLETKGDTASVPLDRRSATGKNDNSLSLPPMQTENQPLPFPTLASPASSPRTSAAPGDPFSELSPTENPLPTITFTAGQLVTSSARLPQLTGQIPPLTGQIPPLTEQIPPLTGQIPPLTGQIPPLTEQIPPLTEQIPQMTEQISQMTGQIPQMTEQIPQMTEQIPQMTEQISQMTGQIPQMTGQIPQMTGQNPQMTGPDKPLTKEERELKPVRQAIVNGLATAEEPARKTPNSEITGGDIKDIKSVVSPVGKAARPEIASSTLPKMAESETISHAGPQLHEAKETAAQIGEPESVSGEISKSSLATSRNLESPTLLAHSSLSATSPGAAGGTSEVAAPLRSDVSRLIEKVWEAADTMNAAHRGRMDLDIPLQGDESVRVRVELRSGEIHATIRSDSPELREALEKLWPDFSVKTVDRGLKLADASFSPLRQDGGSWESGQNSRRDPPAEQGGQSSPQPRRERQPISGGQTSGRFAKASPPLQVAAPARSVTLWA